MRLAIEIMFNSKKGALVCNKSQLSFSFVISNLFEMNIFRSLTICLVILLVLSCSKIKIHNFYEIGIEFDVIGPKNDKNFDNLIYKSNAMFIYDYRFYKHKNDSLYYKIEYFNTHCENSKNLCCFDFRLVRPKFKYNYEDKKYYLDKMILAVYENKKKSDLLEDQTLISYSFFNMYDTIKISKQLTGIIEDSTMLFVHHPRNKGFLITEFCPSIYLPMPIFVGKKYSSNLSIPNDFAKELKLKDTKSSTTRVDYEVISLEPISTNIGQLMCYKIYGRGENDIYGKTSTLIYFNSDYGIIKLVFENIDNSKIIFDIVKVK